MLLCISLALLEGSSVTLRRGAPERICAFLRLHLIVHITHMLHITHILHTVCSAVSQGTEPCQ